VPPHPPVPGQRNPRARRRRRDKQDKPHPSRRLPHTINAKQQEISDQEAKSCRAHRFDDLDRPEQSSKLAQLRLQPLRQPQPFRRIRDAHWSVVRCQLSVVNRSNNACEPCTCPLPLAMSRATEPPPRQLTIQPPRRPTTNSILSTPH